MTLDQLATEVMARLNLTSPESEARIKRELNDAYRRVTSAIGLVTTRRTTATEQTTPSDPALTFSLDKLENVYVTATGNRRVLPEVTYADYRDRVENTQNTGMPQCYAIETYGAGFVTIVLFPTPNDVINVSADGYRNLTTLDDADEPNIPADYHDALIYDTLRVEYMKLEKKDLSVMSSNDYEKRLAELRYFIAKSNALNIAQGQLAPTFYRGRRWMKPYAR